MMHYIKERAPRLHRRLRLGAAIFAAALLLACRSEWKTNDPSANSEDIIIVGEVGRQPGQFVKPRAVEISSDGRLIVIDRSGRIQSFDTATGELLSKWMLLDYSNGTPTGMSLDRRDNTIWIADTHYQRILHYDLDGNLLWQFGGQGTEPGKMIFPTDVCPDPLDGSLWVTEFGLRSRIIHFSSKGEFIAEWGSDEYEYSALQRPMAITIDDAGRLFIADAGNHRILIYGRDGKKIGEWGDAGMEPGKLKYPYDLSFAPDGTLYICEYGTSRISHFTTEGEFLGCWGGPGHKPGFMYSPWGVAVGKNGRLAVADTNNGRVQLVIEPERFFKKENPA